MISNILISKFTKILSTNFIWLTTYMRRIGMGEESSLRNHNSQIRCGQEAKLANGVFKKIHNPAKLVDDDKGVVSTILR